MGKAKFISGELKWNQILSRGQCAIIFIRNGKNVVVKLVEEIKYYSGKLGHL